MLRRTFLTQSGVCAALAASGDPTYAQGAPAAVASAKQSENGVVVHPFNTEMMHGFPPKPEHQVTLENWLQSQANSRWMVQHLEELIPTHVIRCGERPVYLLPRRPVAIDAMQLMKVNGQRVTVAAQLSELDTDAFLLVKDGHILSEQYFSGMTQHTPHVIFSCNKAIISTLIGILLETGELKEDQSVDKYIPELQNSGYAGTTVRQLLDMQSGAEWSIDSWGPYTAAMSLGPPGKQPVPMGAYNFIPAMKQIMAPAMVYKNPDPLVLTWAAEKVTGVRFADLLSQRLWTKLGMEHDARVTCDMFGHGSDFISLTARDFARWGLMCLDHGRFDGQQLVPKPYFEFIRTQPLDFPSLADVLPDGVKYRNYFGVWPSGSAIAAGGLLGQRCYIDFERNVVIVWFATFDMLRKGENPDKAQFHACKEIAKLV